MGELWASYGRAMGELWATIARHIFTTLTLTMACGTVYAPLELSICTTMSMSGNVPPFTPMTLILKVGLFAKMSFLSGTTRWCIYCSTAPGPEK